MFCTALQYTSLLLHFAGGHLSVVASVSSCHFTSVHNTLALAAGGNQGGIQGESGGNQVESGGIQGRLRGGISDRKPCLLAICICKLRTVNNIFCSSQHFKNCTFKKTKKHDIYLICCCIFFYLSE